MIKKNTKLVSENIDGLVCLFDVQKQISYDLDKTGSEIWNLVEDNVSIDDISVVLFEKYDVDFEILKKDVERFVYEFIEMGLFINL
ncbi:MAG: PqqD family protein [Defluviitaleaceae bacterium]|nr:PqqD family protein [Defluviitaleaceae bacterium]